VDLTLERYLVGLYFSLEKKFPPPPPCEGELVDRWNLELDPRKVETSKDNHKTIALIGV
jgi:hypothetical protein